MRPSCLRTSLFFLFLTICSACNLHSDCSNSTVSGYCLRVTCYPLSAPYPFIHPLAPSPLPTSNLTRSFIVHLTNTLIPLSLDIRRATLRRIRAVGRSLNVNVRLYKAIHGRSWNYILKKLILKQSHKTSPFEFHTSLQKATTSFHDLHSQYRPAYPLNAVVATLGFTISQYYRGPYSQPHFILSDFVPGFKLPKCFTKGAHVVEIDHIPIMRAIRKLEKATYGSNSEASFQMAVDALTIRQPYQDPLPERDFVEITIRPPGSEKVCTARLRWVFSLTGPNIRTSPSSKSLSIKPHGSKRESKQTHRRRYLEVKEPYNQTISASILKTSRGELGVLKLVAFNFFPDSLLVEELTRLLNMLPKTGLVVDIRDNLGGIPALCSLLTNLISNVTIPELPMIYRASELSLRALEIGSDLPINLYSPEMETALKDASKAKEEFTGPTSNVLTIGAPKEYQRLKQIYMNPVITLTSARSYSAGDLFAMLQKDLNASYVIGVDETTGGGGAGALSFKILNSTKTPLFKGPFIEEVDFFIPTVRYFRAGQKSGGLVEHFGIEPNERYWRTKDDVLDSDRDLFEMVARKIGM